MAHWIGGGGEQTLFVPVSVPVSVPVPVPVPVPAKRYYADDLELLEEHEKRRRIHHKKYREDFGEHSDRPSDHHNDLENPECDIPYRSIEPRDTPAPDIPDISEIPEIPEKETREKHVFYILYEEGFTAGPLHLQGRLRDNDSHSPLPPARDDYPVISLKTKTPKHWANGAHLRTSDDDQFYPYAYTPSPPAYGTPPPPQWARYEDWRERNCAYDMAADQEEESRSYSPFTAALPGYITPEISVSASISTSTPSNLSNLSNFSNLSNLKHEYFGRDHHGLGHQVKLLAEDTGFLVAGRFHQEHTTSVSAPSAASPSIATPTSMSTSMSMSMSMPTADDDLFISDDQAADNVTAHLASFMRRYPHSRQERILRSLIHPKSGSGVADFELDDEALTNIMRTANDLFFAGRLKNRVQWDWSGKNSDPQYDCKIIGHTSLRVKKDEGGIETFVLLSTPILKNKAYSRRLLISAFLHELVHCYLFICCGWKARKDGGHTDGFRRIADTIDQWAGRDKLFLCQVEADLEQFRQAPLHGSHGTHGTHGAHGAHDAKKSYVLDQSHHVCRPANYSDAGRDHEQSKSEHDWWSQHRRNEW